MIDWNELRRLPGGAVPALLFWLGGGSILVSAIIGLQMAAVDNLRGQSESWMLAVPVWGAVALMFALILRFWSRDGRIQMMATAWLALAFFALIWVKYA